jgi:hypothetical protein
VANFLRGQARLPEPFLAALGAEPRGPARETASKLIDRAGSKKQPNEPPGQLPLVGAEVPAQDV